MCPIIGIQTVFDFTDNSVQKSSNCQSYLDETFVDHSGIKYGLNWSSR